MSDHAFRPETEHLLECASSLCSHHGAKLTRLRRHVLGLVIESPKPPGAYDLLQRLADIQGRTAPPTVYRTLDFLVAEGLVHKIELLAAYVACTHHLHHQHDHAPHAAQFLICTQCGRVDELENAAVQLALQQAAGAAGFHLGAATIEAAGLCAGCAGPTG